MRITNVPVVMLHSVMSRRYGWHYEFLSELADEFERKLIYLKSKNYKSIKLKDLYEYMKDGKKIPERSIVLTFDDGYLDNWVVAYPLLKKYGFMGVIFVNHDFVDPIETYRYTLDDLWDGRCKREDVKELGFLSWAEMRKMEEAGIMEIQSHSLTHTWYFKSADIVDFHHPGDQGKYPWIAWNARPDQQYRWMMDNQEEFVQYGTPIYDFGRSLGIKKYFDDPALREHMINYVKLRGNIDFFKQPSWKDELCNIANQYSKEHKLQDSYETDQEYMDRVRNELRENKRILEENLNKKIEFLCWPGGAYNDYTLRIAQECGYLASTVKEGCNTYGDDPSKINRISSGNPEKGDVFPWCCKILTFAFYLERFRGNNFCKLIDKVYRLK